MKLELKENMYVRTKDGYISQYKYYDTSNAYMGKLLCIPLSNGTFANIENIKKFSYNIIDILEVGDYVNGSWVNEFVDNKPIHEDYNDPFYSFGWENEDIKTVVTHEQMEQMAYKVEK